MQTCGILIQQVWPTTINESQKGYAPPLSPPQCFYLIQYPTKLNHQARQGGSTEAQVNSVWPGYRGSITHLFAITLGQNECFYHMIDSRRFSSFVCRKIKYLKK